MSDSQTQTTERIAKIELDDGSISYRSPEVEHERAIAIADLQDENQFEPMEGKGQGPYYALLKVTDNRLHVHLATYHGLDGAGQEVAHIIVPVTPFRKIIKDYFLICESYFDAIRHGSPSHIEAIDMGRRGVHNEGSELLMSLLEGKARLDFDTARRLFTLLCVLHIK